MDINNLSPVEKFSQSMDTKEICILVINDDYVCFNIIASMLKKCTYEDFNFERPSDAIKAVWERKDKIEVILTNAHRADVNSFGMIQHIIEKDFKLPTFLLSPDENTKIISSGLPSGVTLCFVKDLSFEEMKKLYENTLACERGEGEAIGGSRNGEKHVGETSNNKKATNASSGDDANQETRNKKRKERGGSSSGPNDDSEDESHVQKKKRVVWTDEMHQKFVDAMTQIGYDRAFPKKIVELMNVSGLTRENVASHLQKYRMCLKKLQEGTDKYPVGLNPSTSLGPSHHYWNSSQLASRNYLSMYSAGDSMALGSMSSRVRLAPPSYRSFDANMSGVTIADLQRKLDQTVNVNENFQVHTNHMSDILMRILNKKPTNNDADDQGTSSKANKSSFMGLILAEDGKSLHFGDSGSSEIRTDLDFSTRGNNFPTRGNDFQVQQSGLAPMPNFITDSDPQDYSLPPLPGSYVDYSSPVTDFDESMIMNSHTIGQTDTLLGQQSSMHPMPWETLGTLNADLMATNLSDNLSDLQISLPPLPSEEPWYPYSDSNILQNQSHSLQPTLLQEPWNPNPELPSSSFINQSYSQMPMQSDYPWNLDQNLNPVLSTFSNNFLDQQNVVPPLLSQPHAHQVAPLHSLPAGTGNEAGMQPSMSLPPELNGFGIDGGTEDLLEGTRNTSPELDSLGALAAEFIKDFKDLL